METKPSPQTVVTDWAKSHWQLLGAFAAGALLGAITVQQGYEGFRFGGAEYVLIFDF